MNSNDWFFDNYGDIGFDRRKDKRLDHMDPPGQISLLLVSILILNFVVFAGIGWGLIELLGWML